MSITHFINVLVTAALPHTYLEPVAVILGTFILEDATTMLVGVLSADGFIHIPVALVSLYLGIILGDFGLYFLGYFASSHPWARRFVRHNRYERISSWLEERFEGAVFTSRFVPGLRLPTYTAAGFLKLPFKRFVPPVVIGTLIWTSLFFSVAYLFGNITANWLGVWRWPVALGIIAVWFAINHRRLSRKTAK